MIELCLKTHSFWNIGTEKTFSPSSASRTMLICLGSKSPLKRDAIAAVWPDAQIKTFDVDSRVPEQPVGQKQTLLGAQNRCRAAFQAAKLKENQPKSLVIGIENGIWTQPRPRLSDPRYPLREVDNDPSQVWVDGAAISILDVEHDTVHEYWTDVIFLPKIFQPGPNGIWSHIKDPHFELTGKSRKSYIEDTLVIARKNFTER